MRNSYIVTAVATIMTVCFAVPCAATEQNDEKTDQSPKISICSAVPENTVRRYDVSVRVTHGDDETASSGVRMTVQHKYFERTREGTLPMEVSLDGGALISGEQSLAIYQGVYPKLTVLFDDKLCIQNVLGTRVAQRNMSGINYSNMIILFYLSDCDKERSIGRTWESVVSMPNAGQSFQIANTLIACEAVDGVDAAIVNQVISRKSDSTSKTTAQSYYALDDGRLLKSHVAFDIPASGDATAASVVTDIKLAN